MKSNCLGTAVGTKNPQPWPLGHKRDCATSSRSLALLTGDDIKTVTRFFVEVLGFRQSERVVRRKTKKNY